MAKKVARLLITLACSVCHQRNYAAERGVRPHDDRLVLRKYCPYCRKVTGHHEVR